MGGSELVAHLGARLGRLAYGWSKSPIGNGRAAAVVWLVPIHSSEHEFVRRHGWSAFEELLQERDPDLFDPLRPSIVEGSAPL